MKRTRINRRRTISFIVLLVLLLSLFLTSCDMKSNTSKKEKVQIGIAWRADTDSEFYTNVWKAIEDAGATPVLLDQVRSVDLSYTNETIQQQYIDANDILKLDYAQTIREKTYKASNAEEVMNDIHAVVFTGGEDISPTLYETPEAWHKIAEEKDYNATRDVSDYLLMSYCLENDISLMGLCRGMQMLSVISGATVIQDIPTYFSSQGKNYKYEHRNQKEGASYRDYSPHNIDVIDTESLLYKVAGTNVLENVPSWHHQAVKSVEHTNLKVTGLTTILGEQMIETVEVPDKTFAIGLQFHPEAAIVKHLEGADNKDNYMDYMTAIQFFKALKDSAS